MRLRRDYFLPVAGYAELFNCALARHRGSARAIKPPCALAAPLAHILFCPLVDVAAGTELRRDAESVRETLHIEEGKTAEQNLGEIPERAKP